MSEPIIFKIEPGQKFLLMTETEAGVEIRGFRGDSQELATWLHQVAYQLETCQGISFNGKDTPNG